MPATYRFNNNTIDRILRNQELVRTKWMTTMVLLSAAVRAGNYTPITASGYGPQPISLTPSVDGTTRGLIHIAWAAFGEGVQVNYVGLTDAYTSGNLLWYWPWSFWVPAGVTVVFRGSITAR